MKAKELAELLMKYPEANVEVLCRDDEGWTNQVVLEEFHVGVEELWNRITIDVRH